MREAILSGWIATGPRTKKLEGLISEYVGTEKTVCLNSATAALEMVLHLLDIQLEDEVIVPAYTYTATVSVTQHMGCKLVMVDSQKDSVEMDYDKPFGMKPSNISPCEERLSAKAINLLQIRYYREKNYRHG